MKILITGDFCPINRADINKVDAKKLLCKDFQDLLKQTDIKITNLECPLTNNSEAIIKTGPALKSDPDNVKLITEMGFNLLTLANNHIMDYGSKGLKDTLEILNGNNIEYVGAGNIKDEIDVIYKTKDDITVAIINVCENEWSTDVRDNFAANGFSEIKMFYTIKKAKQNASKVMVIHHGGHEMYNLPSPRLKEALRFFVDCGADAVINHHTHCVGGYEIYNKAPIFYSLGNFIFDVPAQRNSIWNYGMGVVLSISQDDISFNNFYFSQFNEAAKVEILPKQELLYAVDELNNIIKDDIKLEQEYTKFVNTKKRMYNAFLEPIKSRYILAFINRKWLPSIWHSRKKLYLKNLITCESHREIVKSILQNETSQQ
ncbi:CapA family protein [Gelidibacter japonicus]|uniref:CapA family protein n=1 Tax=Gelidibacter japonicus TaxID=1962232 RepID=UPI002AFDDAB7|nr:CapA family protein [Gelidibacter japonicus]